MPYSTFVYIQGVCNIGRAFASTFLSYARQLTTLTSQYYVGDGFWNS